MLLSRICFLCLDDTGKNLKTVFSDGGDNILLLNKVEYLLSSDLLILEPDNPERICSACVNKLNFFYEFKQSSLENGIRVKQLIRNEKMSVTNQFQPINKNISNNDTSEFEEETSNNNENDSEPETDKFCENNDGDSPGNINEDLDGTIDIDEDNRDESLLESEIDIKEEFIDLANSIDNNIYNETELERNQCDQNTASVSNVDPSPSQNSAISQETNERFQCGKCEKTYKHKMNLKRHIKKKHYGKPYENKKVQCNICDRVFGFKHYLVLHLRSHQIQACEICGTSFRGRTNLSKHMKIHECKYLCTECNTMYKKKSSYNNHLITHYGVRDFKCSICNKGFLTKYKMKKHERNHKEIVCEICNAIFEKKTHFMIHMNFHSNIRNFKCNDCEETFVTKSMLSVHIETHK